MLNVSSVLCAQSFCPKFLLPFLFYMKKLQVSLQFYLVEQLYIVGEEGGGEKGEGKRPLIDPKSQTSLPPGGSHKQ